MSLSSEASRGRASVRDARLFVLPRVVRFWLHHYGPQDLIAGTAALAACLFLSRITEDAVSLALACAAVETLVFYGVVFARRRQALARDGRHGATRRILLELLHEYGPAELADVVLRPTAMAACMGWFGSPAVGLLAGTAVADVLFYSVATLSFLRSRRETSPRRPT